jgi:ABC-2 type transport system permease protein
MMRSFTGTWPLFRVAARRDRIQLSIWVLGIAALITGIASVLLSVFDTQQELELVITSFGANPVIRAFGIPAGASAGSLLMLRAFVLMAVLVGLMSAMAVVRHTRQNEDTGRAELIGSTAVGRHASMAAALILVVLANAALAVLVAGGLILNDLPADGAIAAGVALGAVGTAFAGLAAITVQIAPNARPATGFAAMGIGVAYLLSAAGGVLGSIDATGTVVSPAWISWLSPIGWGQLMRPFGETEWVFLLLFAAWFVVTVAIAFALEARRDLGRGLLPEHRGPPRAAPRLLSPLGLAWRLNRGLFIGWAIGVAVLGGVFGAVSNAFDDLIRDVEEAADLFLRIGGTEELTDAFFAVIVGMMAIVIAVFTTQTVLRMRGEETDGLLEPVLATAVSRTRWMAAHVTVAAVGSVALLLIIGVSAGLLAGITTGELGTHLPTLTAAALTHVPAVLLIGGIAVLLVGAFPRVAGPLAWTIFTVSLVTGPMFGQMLDLNQALLNISPFTHVPAIPAEDFRLLPMLVLSALMLVTAALGLLAFRRRDLAPQTIAEGARLPFFGRLRRERTVVDEPATAT